MEKIVMTAAAVLDPVRGYSFSSRQEAVEACVLGVVSADDRVAQKAVCGLALGMCDENAELRILAGASLLPILELQGASNWEVAHRQLGLLILQAKEDDIVEDAKGNHPFGLLQQLEPEVLDKENYIVPLCKLLCRCSQRLAVLRVGHALQRIMASSAPALVTPRSPPPHSPVASLPPSLSSGPLDSFLPPLATPTPRFSSQAVCISLRP